MNSRLIALVIGIARAKIEGWSGIQGAHQALDRKADLIPMLRGFKLSNSGMLQ
jgi:hypothetical protein